MENKLENIEAIFCIVILTIADIVLISSQILIKHCNSASILNSVYISLVAIALTFILCLLSKQFIGQSLLDISNFLGGKALKIIIGFSYTISFIFGISIFLRKMSETLQIIYYPLTNILFIIALFCIVSGIIANLGNNSIFKSCVIVVPIIFFTMILIFIGNVKNYNYENVYPILGNGINETFLLGTTNIFAFSGLAYLFFLPTKLKNPEKIMKIGLTSCILSFIFLLVCIASVVLLFSDVLTHSELFPLYIAVRYIEFGTFFQRLDAAFLFLCVIGFICVLALNTYFIISILKDITNISTTKPLTFPCFLTIFGISLIIKQNSTLEFLQDTFAKIMFIVFGVTIPFVIMLLAIIKKKRHKEVSNEFGN